jgi:hypothetical protein
MSNFETEWERSQQSLRVFTPQLIAPDGYLKPEYEKCFLEEVAKTPHNDGMTKRNGGYGQPPYRRGPWPELLFQTVYSPPSREFIVFYFYPAIDDMPADNNQYIAMLRQVNIRREAFVRNIINNVIMCGAISKKATDQAIRDVYETKTGQYGGPGGPADVIRKFTGVQPIKRAGRSRKIRRLRRKTRRFHK